MQSILVLSQKGGVGKSTIADEIAFALERAGTPFAFYSLDEQGDQLHESNDGDGAAVAVIDTPGSLGDDAADMVRGADLVIIPTRASGRDMTALERTRDLVAAEAPAVPVLIIINGWNRWRNARAFREWLEETLRPTESVAVLSQSEAVPRAEAAGVSIVAYAPRARAAQDIMDIMQQVRGMLREATT